jgi:pimeloyl-ACP methyl ester carboxylesterase
MRGRMGALALVVLVAFASESCGGVTFGDASETAKRPRKKRRRTDTMTPGCSDARYLPVPSDAAEPGPWPVGLRTVHAAGVIADVYYPATPGSADGVPAAKFDIRDHLPPEMAAQVKAAKMPSVPCACSRDLPVDTQHGPFPVIYFFHGRGLTRAEFPTLCAHLAGRGFVVVAPDLPGVNLSAYLGKGGYPDRKKAMLGLIEAVGAANGELAFLAGRLDGKIGLVGHSMGAGVVDALVESVGDVAVVMGGAGAHPRSRRVPVLVMGGTLDGFAPYRLQVSGYQDSPRPKRLVGVRGAGHMLFADHCTVSPEFGGWYGAAVAYGVPFTGFLLKLAEKGCADAEVPTTQAHGVILSAITAELEETLTCSPAAAEQLDELADSPAVDEYRNDP